MKETNLSSICSWMRLSHSLLLSILCIGQTLPALGEEDTIRLSPFFRDLIYFPMVEHKTVGEVLDRENLGVEAYVRGIDSCDELLAIPKGTEPAYDKSQNFYSLITRIKAECWALVQLDPGARVAPLENTDKLDENAIEGIRAFFETLPGQLSFPADVLTEENGATLACKGPERCALSAPVESEWAEYNMNFHLFLVDGDRKYIAVMDTYEGRPGFVFGVEWSDSAERVLDMFPRLN